MRFIWFRALMMTISLIFVIIAIRNLNNSGISSNIASTLGAPPTGLTAKVTVSGKLNWCETRVEALSLSNGIEIRQENLKWIKTSPSGKQELDSLAMEKWLGRNCTVDTELTQGAEGEIPVRLLTVNFIKGNPQTLRRYPSGEFAWIGQTFKSPQLVTALEDLEALPTASR